MAKLAVLLFVSAFCGLSRARTMAGGWSRGDVGDPHVQELALASFSKMQAASNDLFVSKMIEVTEVKSQVCIHSILLCCVY